MSELTPCNFCDLQDLKYRWGEQNVRTRQVPASEEMGGWTVAEVQEEENVWKAVAWFMTITDHCVCFSL